MRNRQRVSRSDSVAPATPSHPWVGVLTDAVGWQTLAGFVVLACITIGARFVADLEQGQLADDWLLLAAIRSNIPLFALGAVALAAVQVLGRGSLLLRWGDLDRGTALRVFTGTILAAITWRFVTADFDWVYGQWWTADRIGLVLMGALALWRPIGIVPFVVQLRILQTPLGSGFGFALGVTPDGLPRNALAAVAATAIVAAVVGHRRTSIIVSLLSAATAIEFFVSGRLKLEAGWIGVDDLSNFPLNGYYQGWLGSGDGELASTLSTFFDTFRWPLLFGTLLIEVGSIVLLARRRSLLLALGSFVVFHAFVFASFGFSFLEWAIVELGLAALLLGRHGRDWSAPAFRPVPVVVTMLFVFFGSAVFNPPSLFWFDGPVAYAYEFDAVDVEGNPRILVANDFTPHESSFAFAFLHLGPTKPVAAGYGAMNRDRLDATASVSSFAELERLEDPLLAVDQRRGNVVANIEQFLLASGRTPAFIDRVPGGLTRYATSRDGQNYKPGIGLVSMTVTRVTTLRVDGEALVRREPVATFRVDGDRVAVDWAQPPG